MIDIALLTMPEIKKIVTTYMTNQAQLIMFLRSKIVCGVLYLQDQHWLDEELHLHPTPIMLTHNVNNRMRWEHLHI